VDGFEDFQEYLLREVFRRLLVSQELVRAVQDQSVILFHDQPKRVIVSTLKLLDYFAIIHPAGAGF
jgi:hypothetical protein